MYIVNVTCTCTGTVHRCYFLSPTMNRSVTVSENDGGRMRTLDGACKAGEREGLSVRIDRSSNLKEEEG